MKNIIAILVLISFTASGQTPKGYQIGDIVSPFTLKNVDNKSFSLNDVKNAKGFIIVFTANTCEISQLYAKRVKDLNDGYKVKGYPVIAINPNDAEASVGDNFEAMQKLSADEKYSFPYLYDPGQIVTSLFGLDRTPYVFILNKTQEGLKLVYKGSIDNDPQNNNPEKIKYAENALNEILESKKVTLPFAKGIGCRIKWKKN